jgi:SAM-dependent methyltransferase
MVADGYDAIGETFAAWRERIIGDPRREWEDELVARLAPGARILELGCGAGTAETQRQAQRFAVTGVDISPRQVERARAAIPEAEHRVERAVRQLQLGEVGAEEQAGFTIERDEVVTFVEPEGEARFQWVLAQA